MPSQLSLLPSHSWRGKTIRESPSLSLPKRRWNLDAERAEGFPLIVLPQREWYASHGLHVSRAIRILLPKQGGATWLKVARRLLDLAVYKNGRVFPSRAYLAAHAETSTRTVARVTAYLTERGLINKSPSLRRNGSYSTWDYDLRAFAARVVQLVNSMLEQLGWSKPDPTESFEEWRAAHRGKRFDPGSVPIKALNRHVNFLNDYSRRQDAAALA